MCGPPLEGGLLTSVMRIEALKPLEGESIRDKTSPSSFRHQLEQNNPLLYDGVVDGDDDDDDDDDDDVLFTLRRS